MTNTDRWLSLPEIAKLLGLGEDSIKRLAKRRALPLRRITPYATPGMIESELLAWLKVQPLVGQPVRPNRRSRRRQEGLAKKGKYERR